MKLMKLLQGVEVRRIVGETERDVEGIAYHSNRVQKGFLFAAIRGMEVDGHRFIGDAIHRGAGAVIVEEEQQIPRGTMIVVPNSRQALAQVSASFYGNPSSRISLIGITGTNGKTTTAYLLESILRMAGCRVGVLGTINYRYGEKMTQAITTTPESLDLQRMLWEMVAAGVSHVIMEVSSHGLHLDRVFGCDFDGAVFTNFTSDHLDYHKTSEHYFHSKRRLFSEVLMKSGKSKRFAVTNNDDACGAVIVEGIHVPVIHYGLHPHSQVLADQLQLSFEGVSCRINTPKGSFSIRSTLIGRYNVHNILAAVATGMALDIPVEALRAGVEALKGVPGRFEQVENGKGIHVIVDYAHTQDALERVLLGLRDLLSNSPEGTGWGKIITVFGCGGDRDRTKRPLMGEVAGKYSDLAILTSDNPRTEDPLVIIEEVERGLKSLSFPEYDLQDLASWRGKKGYIKIPDRRKAIRLAIRLTQPSDMVLIAGKGHEDYQIIGKQRFPFDDCVEARKALEDECPFS